VLVVGGDAAILKEIRPDLDVVMTLDEAQTKALIETRQDILVAVVSSPDVGGFDVLITLREQAPDVIRIWITSDPEHASRSYVSINELAHQVVRRPWEPGHLGAVVRKAVRTALRDTLHPDAHHLGRYTRE
jgi:response regulator RpfG family c-di-GMP phosphodiesterase